MRKCKTCDGDVLTKTGPSTCIGCRDSKKRDYYRQYANNYYQKHKHRPKFKKAATARAANWRNNNRERYRQLTNQRRRQQREDVIQYYGGKCACVGCDVSQFEFLAIDHVNGGGNKHRKEVGAGKEFVAWLIRNDYPTGYRVLCHNCNLSIGYYGFCPHSS